MRDKRLVNFAAVIEHTNWTRESWTDRGHLADAQAAFAGWHPQVRAILAAADDTFLTALFDRPPLERWSVGRVTLLGDACHPMLPFMAQGAAQAIEDGATLTACLTQTEPDIAEALRRYERLRIPRTSRLQALSAANKTRLHLPDGPQQHQRDAQLATGSSDWSVGTVAWIYNHDPAVLDPTSGPELNRRATPTPSGGSQGPSSSHSPGPLVAPVDPRQPAGPHPQRPPRTVR
jgi:salicylate hydroxylase